MEYARSDVTLYICGRNQERLNSVKLKCQAKGAVVYEKVIDVSDQKAMEGWIHASKPLDMVIANAGIGKSFKFEDDLAGHAKEVFDVNWNGTLNTVHPAIDLMKKRKHGQIAIISSLSGYHGMPSAPAYSTSKVAVKAYGEALRGFYHKHGIKINVICPGFVRSRITDKNDFPMPFFMEADKAAKIIRKGLEKNKGHIAFPWQTKLMFAALIRLLPEFILDKILRRLPDK